MMGNDSLNWRKFVAECQKLIGWLDTQGFADSDQILLKALILIWRGHLSPEDVLARAITISSLQDAARDNSPVAGDLILPDEIAGLLVQWFHSLPRDLWFLGEIYERLSINRRIQGLFYTSPEIIDFILQHTVDSADIVSNPYIKVLDPACGCGYFLLRTYDVLKRKFTESRADLAALYPGQDWSDSGIHRHIISRNLWGADINSVAIDLAAACLLLKNPAESDNLQLNLLVCDSLRRPQETAPSLDRAFWSAYYDYVVGNPPYLSFGLRGTKRLESGYENYLRQAFPASAEYKLSYYVLFMERGIEMLVEGGKLGFIVPDSFLLGRYYSKIRRYILNNTAIEMLVHILLPVFQAVSVGMSAVCILRRESNPLARAGQMVTIYQAEGKDDLRTIAGSARYSQSYFEPLPHNRFRIFPDLTVKGLIDKIDDNSIPLVNFASGHSGIRSLTKQADLVGVFSGGQTWQRGLISGNQVQRYCLDYRGHWLNINPEMLYKGGWDPVVITQRKILLRQTGYTLIACIDDDGFYHLNNIHSFVLKNGSISLDYLLILLNSRLMSFYYHAVAMEYGRAMAQTDIDTLELLPVMANAKAESEACKLASVMQALSARRLSGEEGLEGKIAALDDLLNQLVYQVYNLSTAEVTCIERYEAKLAVRRRHRVKQ